jgi:hypothetical protein
MKPRWALVLIGLVVVACGGAAESDRFDLKTPGANTGAPLPATPEPTAAASPEGKATPVPTPEKKPVTAAEKSVIRGWSDELRQGHVTAAARYFSVPTLVANASLPPAYLDTFNDVKAFNRTLPCGAELIRTRRGVEGFVVGIFRLTERPGAGECGTGTGDTAAVAFLIRKRHITQWVRVDPDAPDPTPTPDPKATVTPLETSDPNSA